jgi:hypothetical protein
LVTPPEIVHRPDPGLARGLWEAQPSGLYVALGVILLAALVYLAVRLGVRRRLRSPEARRS